MELYTNFFELHIGFPDEGSHSRELADSFLMQMRRGNSPDWTASTVRAMHPYGENAALDPHNVPGRLGWLVSRRILQADRSWDLTRDKVVLPACDQALEELSRLRANNARLEIEFPFACFASTAEERGGGVSRSVSAVDPVEIEEARLHFPFGTVIERVDPISIANACLSFLCGTRLEAVPEWEIHFVFERIPERGTAGVLQVDEVAEFLKQYRLEIEQTIEYRSAAMEASGRKDFRLIGTAYFKTVESTEAEARRVFYQESLCQDALNRGYNVRLILEHIVACVKPVRLEATRLESTEPISAGLSR